MVTKNKTCILNGLGFDVELPLDFSLIEKQVSSTNVREALLEYQSDAKCKLSEQNLKSLLDTPQVYHFGVLNFSTTDNPKGYTTNIILHTQLLDDSCKPLGPLLDLAAREMEILLARDDVGKMVRTRFQGVLDASGFSISLDRLSNYQLKSLAAAYASLAATSPSKWPDVHCNIQSINAAATMLRSSYQGPIYEPPSQININPSTGPIKLEISGLEKLIAALSAK